MEFFEKLKAKFGEKIIEGKINYGIETISVKKENIFEIIKYLKEEENFNFLMDLFGVDWLNYPQKKNFRFEVIYNLYSYPSKKRLIIRSQIFEENPSIDSITSLYNSANWYEREVYDMYGIVFKNHPDLRRILMYDEFQGYPLRKDYPLKKRQPRIRLIGE
jgi:NADH-quinone oxidoreductase subunit C